MKSYRKLSHVQLENQLFVPGYGELKGSILSAQFYPGISMIMADAGVEVQLEGPKGIVQFFLPFGRIEACIYIQQDKKDTPNVQAA